MLKIITQVCMIIILIVFFFVFISLGVASILDLGLLKGIPIFIFLLTIPTLLTCIYIDRTR